MVIGPGAVDFVNATLSNDLAKIRPGMAQYTLCIDDETGGIVDDLMAYYQDDEHVLLVPNAANTAAVVRRLAGAAPQGVTIKNPPRDSAVLAVQGTHAETGTAGRSAQRGAGNEGGSTYKYRWS